MIKNALLVLPALALVAGAVAFDLPARAAEAALTDNQKTEVQQVIKQYLRDNPEVIIEAFQAYQEKQQREQMANAAGKITEFKDKLTAADLPEAGNPKGDITVVEFFDYNCGYCKKAIEDIKSVLETDKNVRFVFFDMPILGPTSMTAAKWAHAAHAQGKFFEFHKAVLEHNGGLNDDVLAEIAGKVGMDVEKAKKDANDPAVAEALEKSLQMGHDIGIQGTPGFIIGTDLFPGYLGQDGLKKAIDDARAGKKG
jgi:protein-disulfide isomerase